MKNIIRESITINSAYSQITLPNELPAYPAFIEGIRRAPDRGYRLTPVQTETALRNALRYIPKELHAQSTTFLYNKFFRFFLYISTFSLRTNILALYFSTFSLHFTYTKPTFTYTFPTFPLHLRFIFPITDAQLASFRSFFTIHFCCFSSYIPIKKP